MVASSNASTTPEEKTEVDVKAESLSSLETTGVEWRISNNHQQNLSFSDVRPATIAVRNLNVQADIATPFVDKFKAKFTKSKIKDMEGSATRGVGRKEILKDISADFPAGTLTAIIGGSGSGKTTLLNALSHSAQGSNLTVIGSIHYNGSPDPLTTTSACVPQTDVLLPSLTVRETLLYAASLRLPSSATSRQRSQLVEEIILELDLEGCADTRVGNGLKKSGCSGGERRRVSIGVQMLRNPSVLFLDELTTGLDATSAFNLIKTLKHLADTGRTVITTIHQPRSDIFFLFDRLTLLSRGAIAYTGPTNECLPWFDRLLPAGLMPHVNPADYLIDIVAVDSWSEEAEEESQTRVNRLLVAWSKESAATFTADITVLGMSPMRDGRPGRVQQSVPFLRQVRVLTSRILLSTIRDPFGVAGSWSQGIIMGLVFGLIWYKIPNNLAGTRSAQGALHMLVTGYSPFFTLLEVYRLTRVDIQLFDRERGENLVSGVAWVISRRIAHGILEDFFVPFLFCFSFSYLAGFQGDIGIFLAIVVLVHYISATFALISVAVLRDFPRAALAANLFATMQGYAGGFSAQAATIPAYVRWLKYISFPFYAFGAASVNEFANRYYDCPYGDARTNPACLQYQGSFILESLAYSEDWLTVPLCVLLCFVAFFLASSCLLLQFLPANAQFSASPTQNDDANTSTGREVMKKRQAGDCVGKVDVELVDLSLEVYKPSLMRGKGTTLNVFKGVSAKFRAGELNVILGPSGSGKSSLLGTMAGQLRSSLRTRYRTSGAMLFNGVPPTDKEAQSLRSYVIQDDGALLPHLTVRETLRFAAGLRLPKRMSEEEKMKKAEDVILKMGLKDCADVLVGNEKLRGISGGEKRRVSIAIQVLTEPQILVLDEPTSGLDAFTASSIIKVLEGLAEEGRTIIATIHQSRSDLFPRFENVLLLAKGGQVVYSGKGRSMLPHFASLGYKCPSTTNPADFALDIVSVDVREGRNGATSGKKVEDLIRELAATQDLEKLAVQSEASARELGPVDLKGGERTPMYIAMPILIRRGLLCFKRRPDLAITRIMLTVGPSVLITLFLAPLKTDYFSFQNRLGVIQLIPGQYFVGLLQNLGQYPFERDAFNKEYADGAYSVDSFFFVYMILEIPFEIVSSFLVSLLMVATNLQRTVSMFFLISLISFCLISCGESLGIIFNTLVDSPGLALTITTPLILIAVVMGGILSANMPAFFNGVNYISPLKYAVASLSVKSFTDFEFTCTDSQRLPNGNCPIQTGQQVLDIFNFHTSVAYNVGGLVAVTVGYRLAAYVVLRLSKAGYGVVKKNTEPGLEKVEVGN